MYISPLKYSIVYFFIFQESRYAYTRRILHEPKASAAFHQENFEESRRRSRDVSTRRTDDIKRSVPIDELDHL